MIMDFDEYFKNYVYEPIDLCACYEPMTFPPDGFGDEPLSGMVRRLIFSEKGAIL